jgi:hypothetical protein
MTDTRPFNKRAFVSIGTFISAAILPISGLALHGSAFTGMTIAHHFWMAAHNSAAFLFVIFGAVHITLNWRALVNHMRSARDRIASKEFMAATGIVLLAVALIASHAFHVR